jgi:NADH:ubiquinone oxidoreductase subunit F (NADH-binding)
MAKKLLLEKAHVDGIRFYDAYRREGGYASVEKAFKMTPDEVTEQVKKSGLRGRLAWSRWRRFSYRYEMELPGQARRRAPLPGVQCG